jgi:hypothetical protein
MPEAEQAETKTQPLAAHVRVPVTAVLSQDADVVIPSIRQLRTALSRNWFAAQLRFQIRAGGGRPVEAEWQIEASDAASALAVATQLKVTAYATLDGIKLGDAVPVTTPEPASIPVADLVASRRGRAEFLRWRSSAWRAAMADEARWTLTIDLDAMPSFATEPDSVEDGLFSTYPESPSPGTSVPGLRLVGCRVRLSSSALSPAAPAISALFAEDSRGTYGLQTLPVGSARAPLSWMPIELIAHLLAAPARVGDAFPPEPLAPDRIYELIEGAATPHAHVLGASGQGKTVFLSNLAIRAMSMDECAYVVDVEDGTLAGQCARSARHHDQALVVADFSDPENAPRINLARAPRGVDPHQWIEDLFDILRKVLMADEPVNHFGKVAERIMRALLAIPVLDPWEETRFEDLAELFVDPDFDRHRTELLARIGDRDLTLIAEREIIPMLRQKDPGNTAAWIFSTLQAFTSCWAFHANGSDDEDTLGVEDAVERGAHFILHAPASELGDTGSRILVTVALHRLWLATRRLGASRPRHVLVDEWQRYPSPTLEAMLSMGRKYGLRMRLANQNLAQIPSQLRESVLGNSGAVVCFRVGPADAQLVDGLFPTIPRFALQTLPKHTFAITLGDRDFIAPAPPAPEL